MILEQFIAETSNMSIVHLYFDEKKLDIFDALAINHPNYISYNLSDPQISPSKADIFFIEIGESTKEKLKYLLGLFTKHKPIVSYFFADNVEDKLLLKFALHFDISDVLPLKNDDSIFASLFSKSPNKLELRIKAYHQIERENSLNQLFAYFTYKNNRLVYANDKAKALMGTADINAIEQEFQDDLAMIQLLQNTEEAQTTIILENEHGQKLLYLGFLKSIPSKNEKIISLIRYDAAQNQNAYSSVLNRFDFIEKLKDALAQQNFSNEKVSLICINITNLAKLSKTFSNTTLYDSFKNFLMKIMRLKDERQEVAQWAPNLYVILSQGLSFEQVCEQTRYIQQELINATMEDIVTPVLVSSVMMLKESNLNEALTYIEKISTQSLLRQDIDKIDFYEVDYLDNVVDETEQIAYLMRNCINNKIPLKLLNIYKGLCINTHSSVLKINDNAFYLQCESLQGYAMQLEGETVIQAPNFPKDIKAEVSIVDVKKAYVILKNLRFMAHSANNRQHTRVQTSIRTPILLKLQNKTSVQGEILDISVNSVAVKVGKVFKDDIRNQIVKLNFSLPSDINEHGFITMDIEGKVTFVSANNDSMKIVIMLENLNKPYDEYLLKYMYNRQKELILEVRRATKVYN